MLHATRTVTAPDGRVWTVRRLILPRPPRWMGWGFRDRERQGRAGGADDGSAWWQVADVPFDFADGPSALVAIVLFVVVLAFAWFVVFPVLFFLADLALLLLLAAAGVAFRVLFRRPWRIEASTDGLQPSTVSWAVVGTRASAAAVDAVAQRLAAGASIDDLAPGPRLAPGS